MRIIAVVLCLSLISTSLNAQQDSAVRFTVVKQRIDDSIVVVSVKALITKGVDLLSIHQESSAPFFSRIATDTVLSSRLRRAIEEKALIAQVNDTVLGATLAMIRDSAEWVMQVRALPDDSFMLKGSIDYAYIKGEEYLTSQEDFKIAVIPDLSPAVSTDIEQRSLLWIFMASFAGGLLALLTPCVYSMIPVTVSFFTKRSKTRGQGKRNAVYYAVSIIAIFTLLGFLITLIFGPAALNNLATNWIANLIFFLLFVVFGISFLGAFEISLPGSWSTKADSKAGMGNFMGIFFMALTLVVVSFSCTGPIIGNLLVLAAKGSYWGPLTGMFGFSLALALPFALFAFFPSRLNVLGKAGGWLNAVKVTLGFLELALALKFLSNADLSKGWRLLDREVFLSLWIVLFILLGLYLLGKLKLHHDDELPKNDFGIPYVGVTRLLFAICAFSFAVYMVPGLWGAPLKGISAFVPPMGTQDFVSSAPGSPHVTETTDSPMRPIKYAGQMKIYEPEVVTKNGVITYFDYEEAREASRKAKKPLMLDFTGINCVNCRKMEGQVWSDPEVMRRLKQNFVIASLYVDANNVDLPVNEQYYSASLGRKIETLGDKNADFQVERFHANSQPYYFFVDSRENKLRSEGYGYDPDIKKFISLLDEVKKKYDSNPRIH
ncbi:MAG: protein-disulfide reductase [Citrobacter freundii]|nr:MAG: protein-disulfide reductase [Citrobacter freundii]